MKIKEAIWACLRYSGSDIPDQQVLMELDSQDIKMHNLKT